MISDSEQTIPIDSLVKPGYHERIVLEIDRRDPDMMSFVVVSRNVLAHSIDVVDLAEQQIQRQESESTDSTNSSEDSNDTSSTEDEDDATTAENMRKRAPSGNSGNSRKCVYMRRPTVEIKKKKKDI